VVVFAVDFHKLRFEAVAPGGKNVWRVIRYRSEHFAPVLVPKAK
jgi:hypothetical protein